MTPVTSVMGSASPAVERLTHFVVVTLLRVTALAPLTVLLVVGDVWTSLFADATVVVWSVETTFCTFCVDAWRDVAGAVALVVVEEEPVVAGAFGATVAADEEATEAVGRGVVDVLAVVVVCVVVMDAEGLCSSSSDKSSSSITAKCFFVSAEHEDAAEVAVTERVAVIDFEIGAFTAALYTSGDKVSHLRLGW